MHTRNIMSAMLRIPRIDGSTNIEVFNTKRIANICLRISPANRKLEL